ncbi:hypothetical protein M408DRAFT_173060 [Serendipita vermifera MAFF 305830]|uniref:Uncharacterized protein n=1 Tax=Serendipita vermifera MAFF 305830 TaxID=933852 RepID=A0A0C2XDA9_SERVB|nr:hypothetical protein M408DRAFT_173060 [Serendipita vermifera MAFF 305830]
MIINFIIGAIHPGYVVEFQHLVACLNEEAEYIELSGEGHILLLACQLAGNEMTRERALKSDVHIPDFEEQRKEAHALHESFNLSLDIVAHWPKTAYHHLVPRIEFSPCGVDGASNDRVSIMNVFFP